MTNESTGNDFPLEDFDDSINLGSKVFLALLRLQNKKNNSKKSSGRKAVSCKNVVQFLKANYSWLDGDIKSQVMTALLFFVKIGVVCTLDNGKYRLLVPNSKVMTSICLTRTSHGPQCCCYFTLKKFLKTPPRFCCCKRNIDVSKKLRKSKKKSKGITPTPTLSCGKNLRSALKKKPEVKPPQDEQESTEKKETDKGCTKHTGDSKCLNCLKTHSQQDQQEPCSSCNPGGSSYRIPFNVFSPRDEVLEFTTCSTQK